MAQITSSSTAEYFAKNLQQVGFSSPIKAVLTTLKEAVDNALDACESGRILPELTIIIKKSGKGSSRNSDLIEIIVEDNGPGIEPEDLIKVFGEYLASSKFGKGQCTRGQQGIGISAATTWAQLTHASGAKIISKTKKMRKAIKGIVDVNIKGNKGVLKNKENIDWDKNHGTRVEFSIDGRIQLNGDGGLITYLEGTTLVNPHLTLHYKLSDHDWIHIDRVSTTMPPVPPPTLPHPHTMKLGEFMTHAHLYGKVTLHKFLKSAFSRLSDNTMNDLVKNGLPKNLLNISLNNLKQNDFKKIFQVVQNTNLLPPSTKSVLTIGEEALSKSVLRLGEIDFFSVVTRKPKICDFKPVAIEVALARLQSSQNLQDEPVQVLRFANRVPLQFDKSSCAITKAIESINWKSYGLSQSKGNIPMGPYVFALSVVSPFIKFKNASKETIDGSDELIDEIRLALMQAGQKLSRHIKKENKKADLERKIAHIEQFGPILLNGLIKLTKASENRKIKAEKGLQKILGKDTNKAHEDLQDATIKLNLLKQKQSPSNKLSINNNLINNNSSNLEEPISNKEISNDQIINISSSESKLQNKSSKKNINKKSENIKNEKDEKQNLKKKENNKKNDDNQLSFDDALFISNKKKY